MRAPLPGGWGANAVILAHTFNDMHLPAVAIMVPALMARHELSLSQAVGLATAYSSSAFFLQPLLGLWLDRRQGARLATASSLLCGIGIVTLLLPLPYPALLALAALGGVGSAIFHPHGSALIAGAPGPRQRVMGWYSSSGNFGLALTPLLLPFLVTGPGLEASWLWLLVPGVVSLVLLAIAERAGLHYAAPAGADVAAAPFHWSTHIWGMAPLVLVVALRQWTFNGLTALLPLYVGEVGGGWLLGTRQVSLMALAGTIGAVAGGYLGQRFGARRVTAISLLLSSVFFGLLLATGSWLSWLLIAAGGGALMTSFALLVLVAQEMLPGNRAYAAGLCFGFGSGLGSLGLGLSGWLAEQQGLTLAVAFLTVLPLPAFLLALRLPGDRRTEPPPAPVVDPVARPASS